MKKKILITFIIILSIFSGLSVLSTPKLGGNAPTNSEFNVATALEHIKIISRKPHSVLEEDKVAHEEVRQYILSKSKEYTSNEQVVERNYLDYEYEYKLGNDQFKDQKIDVKNVLVEIPGKSDTGILLMAHYDSRGQTLNGGSLGGSFGAADDGYGVSVLLEMLRIFGKRTDLENSIYVLFTDAEETGMHGAKLEVKNNTDLLEKLNFVINVEARGSSGSAYMFETGQNNSQTIKFYQNANNKITYSVATAVYQVMTNFTDFTEFSSKGYAGLNFSVLDNHKVYHTPNDNYGNVSPTSLAHYGEQIVPLLNEYTSDAKYSDLNYFDSSSNAIFFNLIGGLLITYNNAFAYVMLVMSLLLAGYMGYDLVKKQNITSKEILKTTGKLGIGMLLSIVVGTIISMTIAYISNVKFSLVYVNIEYATLIFILGMIGLIIAAYKLTKKQENKKVMLYATVLINLIFAVASTLLLPGTSFMFAVPALITIILLVINELLKNKYLKLLSSALMIFINITIFVPLMYSLYLALTIGGLGVFFLLAFLPIISVVLNVQESLE